MELVFYDLKHDIVIPYAFTYLTTGGRYGGAIDQQFTKDLFAGTEFSKRDRKSPFVSNNIGHIEDMHEYLARNYIFWTPHPWWALTAEYMFERFKSQGLTDQPRELNTYRVPLGISFFHPSGLSAALKATYFNQDGRFVLLNRVVSGPVATTSGRSMRQ